MVPTSTRKRSVLPAWGAIAMLLGPQLSLAGEVAQKTPVGEAIVGFEGGLAGVNLANLIDGLIDYKIDVPAKLVTPDQPVGLCDVLNSEIKIPQLCTDNTINSVVKFNALKGITIDPAAISPKEGVFIPQVTTEVRAIKRVFDLTDDLEQQQLQRLDNNPTWQKLIVAKESLGPDGKSVASGVASEFEVRTIKKFKLRFPIFTDQDFSSAIALSNKISSRNLDLAVQRIEPEPKSAYLPADVFFKNWCSVPPQKVEGDGRFEDMLPKFYDTSEVVSCRQDGDNPSEEPSLAIADQPIEDHPDLLVTASARGTVTPLPNPQCLPGNAIAPTGGHGTLLATIVASRQNGYGFAGIAPTANVTPVPWNINAGSNDDLKAFLESDGALMPVLLFASNFVQEVKFPSTVPERGTAAWDNAVRTWKRENGSFIPELENDRVRLDPAVAKELLRSKTLLVAAAGQLSESEGHRMDALFPGSPQNLGDQKNVLVVGACESCIGEDKPTLWKYSNRSSPGEQFVGVLAPGGSDIPRYVSKTQWISVPGGTSAAAAFTAGLAAKMRGCYPKSYANRPQQLKERIILSSHPTIANEARGLITGSVIDPAISMLDPRKDWLKTVGGTVNKVEFAHWCGSANIELVDSPENFTVSLKKTRRVSMVDDGLVLQTVTKGTSDQSNKIERFGPSMSASSNARLAAVMKNGVMCSVDTQNLKDLFLKEAVGAVESCDQFEACE